MPQREVTVKLYQVWIAFAAITLSFVIGLVSLNDSINANHKLGKRDQQIAQDAKTIAKAAKTVATQTAKSATAGRKLRDKQAAQLHTVAVHSCTSRHTLVVVVDGILQNAIDESQAHPIHGATPAQQAEITRATEAGIIDAKNAIARLNRKADCQGVKPLAKAKLPPIPKTPRKTTSK